jgi:anti-sigma B factor antagonist
MEMLERTVGDVTVLDLKGKLLMGETDEALRKKVKDLADGGKSKILLNLSDVPYMDSAGLGGLVSCFTTVNNKNGKLKLLGLTTRLKDLLSITKLLTVFETFESEEEAIRSF